MHRSFVWSGAAAGVSTRRRAAFPRQARSFHDLGFYTIHFAASWRATHIYSHTGKTGVVCPGGTHWQANAARSPRKLWFISRLADSLYVWTGDRLPSHGGAPVNKCDVTGDSCTAKMRTTENFLLREILLHWSEQCDVCGFLFFKYQTCGL